MVRRLLTFLTAVLMIGAIASLVFFNSQPTPLWLTPEHQYELRLGYLILGATAVGAVSVFLLLLLREGRWALRQWRVQRAKRSAERDKEQKAEARGLILAGQYAKARAVLSRISKRGSADVVDLVDYAETYIQEGNAAEARSALEKGIKEFGNDPLLLHALARACRSLGDHAAAISALERSIGSYPSSATLHRMLRDSLVETAEWVRADEVQQRLVELLPSDADEKQRLLEIRLERSRLEEPGAQEAALKSLNGMAPDFVPAIVDRSRLLADRGETRAATRLIEKAARRNPSPELFDALENAVGEARNGRLAKFYGKLLATHADDTHLMMRMARSLMGDGKLDEAERVLDGVGIGGDQTLANTLRAEIYRQRSDAARAEEHYRKALSTVVPLPDA